MRSKSLLILFAMLAIMAPAVNMTAADPLVRIKTDPVSDETLIVGQRVRLILDVLDQTGWANVPKLPSLSIPGVIVYAPAGQATRLNETIQGKSYTGQRSEWWIYPQRSGPIMIPQIDVAVQVTTYGAGAENGVKRIKTQSLKIMVDDPQGVPNANGLVVTDQLKVKQTWDSSLTEVAVGDGVVRTIERTIGGAPALVLPDIAFTKTKGVTVYPKAPQSQESYNRSELTSSRVDRAAYVFTEMGTIKLPSIELTWWNLEHDKLETVTLPGQTFLVDASAGEAAALPSLKPPMTDPSLGKMSPKWWCALLSIVAIFVFVWLVARRPLAIFLGLRNRITANTLPPLNP